MFDAQRLESFDLPELAPYRTMRRSQEHQAQRIFVAEGEKVVRRLLESDLEVVSVVMPEDWLLELEPLLNRRPEQLRVFLADKAILETLTGFTMFQGLLALGRLPAPLGLEAALAGSPPPRLWVAVEGLSNAENLGVVVRNCVAFGVQALVAGETCSSPYLRRAVRCSMGTVFQLPVVEPASLVAALLALRRQGVRCFATLPSARERPVTAANLAQDCCLVFGSEGYGLSGQVVAACDEAVAIPMPPNVDSLNVASAAAVFLYEVTRQRRLNQR